MPVWFRLANVCTSAGRPTVSNGFSRRSFGTCFKNSPAAGVRAHAVRKTIRAAAFGFARSKRARNRSRRYPASSDPRTEHRNRSNTERPMQPSRSSTRSHREPGLRVQWREVVARITIYARRMPSGHSSRSEVSLRPDAADRVDGEGGRLDFFQPRLVRVHAGKRLDEPARFS